jgi:2-polyprenyl-6-methoxyphenol hydroxylase-like FAD-dependent oxidoreductase
MRFGHLVVVGGSVAGLLAVAALSTSCEFVTIVEKDDLPAEPVHRRAISHGLQVHALLGSGQAAMETLLPGITGDMVQAGGMLADSGCEIATYGSEGWSGRVDTGNPVIYARRPLIEWAIRKRVLALANVAVVKAIADGLVAAGDGGRVTGVRLKGHADVLGADLVIDASGRSSRATAWLGELGCGRPAEQQLNSYIGYATVPVRLPGDALPDGTAGILTHPHPGNTRGAAIVPCDNGLHLLAGLGMMNTDPPGDIEGLLAHVDAAPSPLVGELARKAEWAGEIATWRMPGSRRRLWERLEPRPDAFLVMGDAVMSFNPLYGQGMSVAAVEAVIIRRLLGEPDSSRDGFAARAQAAFAPTIDTVFDMVVGMDAFYHGAGLHGVRAPSPEAARARQILARLATEDAEAALALKRAAHFFDTGALRSPSIQAKIAAWAADGRVVRYNDPAALPPLLT